MTRLARVLMLCDDEKFRLDLSDYAISNGVFTLHYDPSAALPSSRLRSRISATEQSAPIAL